MADITSFMVGRCGAFKTFAADLERVAGSDATVLFQGESGVGKGLAAQALHALSGRAAGPFVAASLAALAPSLIEAELFGHEQGAFTGAHRARLGRFERAAGGTLCLDEVDTLPAEVQAKLVRVLQTREVEPLGAEGARPVDVRVVSTTQRDLAREVELGRFRRDLYFRLAVVPLRVPPLRARLEDLALLAAHLVERLAAGKGVAPRALSPAALARLAEHPWPGNVRELENALERALVLASPDSTDALPPEAFDFLGRAALGVADELAERALAHGLEVSDIERAMLAAALRRHEGNKAAAAREVGLSRRAFEYRLARPAPSEPVEPSRAEGAS